MLIGAFVVKERQARYLSLLNSEKGRKKLRSYIAHFKDLDERFLQKINTQTSSELYFLLKSKKAPSFCYIISENTEYDGRTLPLQEAIEHLYSSGISYFLCCIPGKLAFFEGEDFNERYLLIENYS
jgi:hypothetical protein